MGCNKLKSFPISDKLLEIVEGELLGDGSIKKGVHQSGFSHHSANREYSEYLAEKITENGIPLVGKGIIEEHYNSRNYYSIQTVKTLEFHNIKNKWYKDKKIIPPDLKITPKLLLHWWLGDGSVRNKNAGVLCSECFTKEDQLQLSEKVNTELDIETYPTPIKCGWRIFVPSKHMCSFLEYIGPSPIKSMVYKWDVRNPGRTMELINIDSEEFERLYIGENKTASYLAKKYNCARKTIYEKASKMGLRKDVKKSKKQSFAWDPSIQKNIVDLYKNGKSLKEIAILIGCGRKVINSILLENNVEKIYRKCAWISEEKLK